MNSTALMLLLVLLGIFVAGWALYWAAALLIAFAVFVMELNAILVLLMFVLFPPSLLAFLAGYALLKMGWKRAPS
jgi:hypothetical protein